VSHREHAIREHHLPVSRTARYCTLGDGGPAVREMWFVVHGYGQLATYFIRHFAVLADPSRLIVAPEALSRFYLDQPASFAASGARVGASWMTREDRLAEIDDHVRFLDTLYERMLADVRADVRVTVLGFSQGVATATRWLCRGRSRADALVLWAGPFPPDLDRASAAPLGRVRVTRVVGDADPMAAPDAVAADEERLRVAGIQAPLIRFAGGHQIDRDTLRSLAR
jgi:predicted esterase